MRGLRGFLADNWSTLLTLLLLITGAIYQLGFKEAELRAMNAFAQQTRDTQIKKVSEFESLKQDVERLKWDISSYGKVIDEVKVDVRAIDKRTQEMEKRMEVVIELLRPRKQ